MKVVLIYAVMICVMPEIGWSAVTAEDGQALFDSIFWPVMQVFALGLTAGLAFKMINRS